MSKPREATKWETAAIAEHLRWHRDADVIRLNRTTTALKKEGKWGIYTVEAKEEIR